MTISERYVRVWHWFWIGPAPLFISQVQPFRTLVLAAIENQPRDDLFAEAPHLTVIRCAARDIDPMPPEDMELLRETGLRLARKVTAEGMPRGRSLVTCVNGINRSAMVLAVALRELTPMRGDRILEVIREARPQALTNKSLAEAVAAL